MLGVVGTCCVRLHGLLDTAVNCCDIDFLKKTRIRLLSSAGKIRNLNQNFSNCNQHSQLVIAFIEIGFDTYYFRREHLNDSQTSINTRLICETQRKVKIIFRAVC